MERNGSVDVNWSFDVSKKNGNIKYNLKRDLVRVIHRRLVETKNNTELVLGYTKANFKLLSNEQSIFYAHPCYQGHKWYDWAMVHFEEKNNLGELFDSLYPSRLIWIYLNQWWTWGCCSMFFKNHFPGMMLKKTLFKRYNWEQTLMYLLWQFQ